MGSAILGKPCAEGQKCHAGKRSASPSHKRFLRGGQGFDSPRLHQSLTAQGVEGNQDPFCDTGVCHNGPAEPSPNRYPIRPSGDSGCSTAVCHNGPEPSLRLPMPSGRSRPPSSRPSGPRSWRQPSGLIVRGRVFYLRLRVPGSLVETVGRTHWVRSLGTGYRDEAIRRARMAAADFERMLMETEGRCEPNVHRPSIPVRRPEPAQPVRPERTFRDLFDLFMADPSRTRVRKTDMVYATLFDMASGLWGSDRPLRAIDREACRDLLDLLRWLGPSPPRPLTACPAYRRPTCRARLPPCSTRGVARLSLANASPRRRRAD